MKIYFMLNLTILIWYYKSYLFLEIRLKFKKFDLRQIYESIYSGIEGVRM